MNGTAKRGPPDDPREWLSWARSNVKRAQVRQEGIYLEDLCFDAQQAAEKAVKAVLICHEVEFPYVHDLAELLALVERAGDRVPEPLKDAAKLTRYAVVTRYPGSIGPVSEEDYEEAVDLAERVVRWSEERVKALCREGDRDG